MDVDGNDVWVATGKGLAWGIGDGYYPGVRENPAWLAHKKTDGQQKKQISPKTNTGK
jgi:hypothetical protein